MSARLWKLQGYSSACLSLNYIGFRWEKGCLLPGIVSHNFRFAYNMLIVYMLIVCKESSIQDFCNRIYPSQIDTSHLTHLNFAFAFIDPIRHSTLQPREYRLITPSLLHSNLQSCRTGLQSVVLISMTPDQPSQHGLLCARLQPTELLLLPP